ncbi:MAG: polysaccharide deacetylase family protein [Bacteroidales bacterium]|jgi:peptidoglycan/xylan/chitin deacetylase (PgdA/CDA1 family)|nr:polysaccharide deacetylase family protein [Bacteroidales bacterium]
MIYRRTPNIVTKIFGKLTWNIPVKDNSLYLTFDDGPTPGVTQWVIDELAKYDAKATFFCLGRNVDRYPDIYNKITSSGHAVGNHTYSHLKGWETGALEYIHDVELASTLIESKLFRPPYGRIRPVQAGLVARRFNLVMWDVLTRDYNNRQTMDECLQNTRKMIKSGSIIVFHDSVKAERNLKYVLPKILEEYSEKGFKFRSIEY